MRRLNSNLRVGTKAVILRGGKKQYALSVVSTEDSLPHGKTGLEVSIDR